MLALAIDPSATVSWEPIDDHGTHAMIVDDFLVDPHALRSIALDLAFQVPAAPDRYPGLKSYLALPGAAAVKSWIAERVLARRFPDRRPDGLHVDDFDDYGGFSVFACDRDHPPPDVEDQHTDDMAWLAGVLHLSTVVDHRGTAMWEHRPTGLQQWMPARPTELAMLERVLGLVLTAPMQRAIERDPRFATTQDIPRLLRERADRRPFTRADDATWRCTGYIPAKWNRLVVYPTWQIHSIVDESAIDHPTVDDMRLTYNVMIEYPIARERTRSRSPYPRTFYRRVTGLR